MEADGDRKRLIDLENRVHDLEERYRRYHQRAQGSALVLGLGLYVSVLAFTGLGRALADIWEWMHKYLPDAIAYLLNGLVQAVVGVLLMAPIMIVQEWLVPDPKKTRG